MTELGKSKILLPLYIYPDPGKWDPLSEAITAYPALDFVVIINPNSGPGSKPWWPNADYVREIPRLNAQPNVRTMGYIRTTYCQRPIEEVFKDIEKYSQWPNEGCPGLSVDGIFFDETPNLYSEEVKAYLDAISDKVKESDGIQGDRTVIHNPGTAVDRRLADPGPDITTVVEVAYSDFQKEQYKKWLATSPYDRARTSYMVHSAPGEEVDVFVQELRKKAEHLFVTDLKTDYYHSFGPCWKRFVAAMAEA